jgi:hypothetical protein
MVRTCASGKVLSILPSWARIAGTISDALRSYSKWLLYPVVGLMLAANVFNLGADIGAMGAAAQLILHGNIGVYIYSSVSSHSVYSCSLHLGVPDSCRDASCGSIWTTQKASNMRCHGVNPFVETICVSTPGVVLFWLPM